MPSKNCRKFYSFAYDVIFYYLNLFHVFSENSEQVENHISSAFVSTDGNKVVRVIKTGGRGKVGFSKVDKQF